MKMKQWPLPYLTSSLPELFVEAIFEVPDANMTNRDLLREIAFRWHDPNCECRFKGAVEKEACLRCKNVRRMILERL